MSERIGFGGAEAAPGKGAPEGDSGVPPTVVIGLGNPLMGDEGVGISVLNRVALRCRDLPGVEFADGGTGGFALLHTVAGRRRAILIDCAFMDCEPGTIRRFTPESVRSRRETPGDSLHDADVLQVIRLSRELGQGPESVVLFGIQPASVTPRTGLSEIVAAELETCADRVCAELANGG